MGGVGCAAVVPMVTRLRSFKAVEAGCSFSTETCGLKTSGRDFETS